MINKSYSFKIKDFVSALYKQGNLLLNVIILKHLTKPYHHYLICSEMLENSVLANTTRADMTLTGNP